MRRLVLALLILAVAAPAATADVSGPEIIGFLNAQRAAHGIPAGITEDPALSDGCAKHNHYMTFNGIGHDEQEGKEGYTPEGKAAAASSVLYQGDHWTAERNPFESAPIHLHQLLAPRLDRSGAFESEGFGCANTQTSHARPAPPADVTYTYPRDGATDWRPSETANEFPYTPGQQAGLPAGATTGPYLYVMFDGPDLMPGQPATAPSATLTGPDGPVEVVVAGNETPGLEDFLPTGMEVIPRNPLAPGQTYAVSVAATVAGRPFSHAWSFTTGALENAVSIDSLSADADRRVRATVASTAPGGTLTLTGPGTPVTVPVAASGPTVVQVDAPGAWTACARSGGGATGYRAAEACRPVTVPAPPTIPTPGPGPGPAVSVKPYTVRLTHTGRKVFVTIQANATIRFKGRLTGGRRRVRLRSRKVLAGSQGSYSWKFKRGVKRVKLRAVVTYKGERRAVRRRVKL